MRILFVVHVGETLGHLVRALSIADQLAKRGCEIQIATSSKGAWAIQTYNTDFVHHPINWEWSHNAHTPSGLKADLASSILSSTADTIDVARSVKPDVIIGFPGLVSTLVARTLGIPHVSVLHGPFLAPLWDLQDQAPEERAILEFARRMCNLANDVSFFLHAKLGLVRLTYDEFLATERIFVPQPGFQPREVQSNITIVNFIRGSIGPQLDAKDFPISDACYVTFGSGNPCDIRELVAAAQQVFGSAIVTTGNQPSISSSPSIVSRPFIASSSLAGAVRAVITHGGLGTIGTFAEFGTPQLIIPTELDQATTAVYASRLRIAIADGLEIWTSRKELGRKLPHLSPHRLTQQLRLLKDGFRPPRIPASGATEIAAALLADSAATFTSRP